MNVSELIKELEKVEDKSKEVLYRVELGWIKIGMNEMRVESIFDNPNRVVLSSDFIPGKRYFKHER